MQKAEVFFLWLNGGDGVEKHNQTSVARFLMRKYQGRYANIKSARCYVVRTLKAMKDRSTQPWHNPFRDGRTTSKKPCWVSSDADLRHEVEERIGTTSCRSLARGNPMHAHPCMSTLYL